MKTLVARIHDEIIAVVRYTQNKRLLKRPYSSRPRKESASNDERRKKRNCHTVTLQG